MRLHNRAHTIFRYDAAVSGRKSWKFWVLVVSAFMLLLGLGAAGYSYNWYRSNISPVNPSEESRVFLVKSGESVSEVAESLEESGLIRSKRAFLLYIRFNDPNISFVEGAYELSGALSSQEIIEKLKKGDILRKQLTIIPGHNLFDVENSLLEAGYSEEQIKESLSTDYSDHPALKDAPEGATLEGYLWPETYIAGYLQSPNSLIGLALDEMAEALADEEFQNGIKKQGLSTHEAVILASIVQQEVGDTEVQKQVAQVFLKRLKEDIQLGSDVTFFYAAELTGEDPSPSLDNPYNTRLYKGLPPGPIGTVTRGSLNAVANPAKGDFLFFVAGDDGNTYFSKTLEEHNANVKKHCIELCKLP